MHALRITTGMLAELVNAKLDGPGDIVLTDVGGVEKAGPGALTFLRSTRYAKMWAESKASAAVVTKGIEVPGHTPATRALLFVSDADLAMIKLLEIAAQAFPTHTPGAGVHPSAVVDPTAKIEPGAQIGAKCVVGPRSVIGANAILMPSVTIGADVRIGAGTMLNPGVVVYDRCTIGARCILHAHVSIGADGFGFRPDPSGRGLIKVPHVGTVEIGNDVEIGANSCVDRGKFGPTTIGDGTKIDNLVQIAHNCRIGRSVIICGVTGIAGSVTIGDGVVIAGCCGIVDNINVGAGARLGAKTGLLEDVPPGETWTGLPAAPHSQQMRTWAAARKLPEVLRALKREGGAIGRAVEMHRRDLER